MSSSVNIADYFHLDDTAVAIVNASRRGAQLWRCPKCDAEVEALAEEVAHRCEANRNRLTYWKGMQ